MTPAILLLLGFAMAHEGESVMPPAADAPIDLAFLIPNAANLHDKDLSLRGRVVWADCEDETCLLELISTDSTPGGNTVLVRYHGSLPASPSAIRGRILQATGHFYTKVYPGYRLEAWQAMGWRSGEKLPSRAAIPRMDAKAMALEEGEALRISGAAPIAAWAGPVFDLHGTEFEEGGMGTGRKCLAPGASTPTHSTGDYQELLYGLQGTVTVELTGGVFAQVGEGDGIFLAPDTVHGLRNNTEAEACYLFVYCEPGDTR